MHALTHTHTHTHTHWKHLIPLLSPFDAIISLFFLMIYHS